ncbi:hypothetical protein [Methylobacterium sp. Leaf117]|uniref:hypothetical protein n=1 Tax=Methylobacterium sp. Leaf117 TaxID=1736260 RepID=UPI0006F7E235|nr:hypothetical protein [Methylobacterium sp. Leaf117]KQP82876.1 hypothetical protein ASF57_12130 [Methylobacterium sp. Leaf117]
MTEPKPFRLTEAEKAFPDRRKGDFMVPYCVPGAQIHMGEQIAVVVVPTQEGQRIGLPMDLQTVSDLHALLGEALRMLQAPEGGSVQ